MESSLVGRVTEPQKMFFPLASPTVSVVSSDDAYIAMGSWVHITALAPRGVREAPSFRFPKDFNLVAVRKEAFEFDLFF